MTDSTVPNNISLANIQPLNVPTQPQANETPHSKPTILHLGDDIRWNQDLYTELTQKFNIIRTYSTGREAFKTALKNKTWGDFVAMYRPFWNTGGEMGNWDEELMYFPLFLHSF
ncbi:hypothetical protein N0V86_009456 [Didymella sp. IMI 355093]|nr:hypothetical protein N0V86_009456 [Didymella sp. IMI 355093]